MKKENKPALPDEWTRLRLSLEAAWDCGDRQQLFLLSRFIDEKQSDDWQTEALPRRQAG